MTRLSRFKLHWRQHHCWCHCVHTPDGAN